MPLGVDAVSRRIELAAILLQLLVLRTGVEIAGVIEGEVCWAKGSVGALGFVEDRNVRLDPAFVD